MTNKIAPKQSIDLLTINLTQRVFFFFFFLCAELIEESPIGPSTLTLLAQKISQSMKTSTLNLRVMSRMLCK